MANVTIFQGGDGTVQDPFTLFDDDEPGIQPLQADVPDPIECFLEISMEEYVMYSQRTLRSAEAAKDSAMLEADQLPSALVRANSQSEGRQDKDATISLLDPDSIPQRQIIGPYNSENRGEGSGADFSPPNMQSHQGRLRDASSSPHRNASAQAPVKTLGSPSSLTLRSKAQTTKIGKYGAQSVSKLDSQENTRQTAGKGVTDSHGQSTADQIEACIQEAKKKIEQTHAVSARWLLRDARTLEGRNTRVRDSISPFASMKSVQMPVLAQSKPKSQNTIMMETFVNKKKLTKSRSSMATIISTSDVISVPKYSSTTMVKRNILTGDDRRLKFFPADPRAEHFLELQNAYDAPNCGSSRDMERMSHADTCLNMVLKDALISYTKNDLFNYSLSICTDKRDKYLARIMDVSLSNKDTEMGRVFNEAWDRVFENISLTDVLLPEKKVESMIEEANNERKSQYDLGSASDTYTLLSCLICHAIGCQSHGDYIKKSSDHMPEGQEEELSEPEDERHYIIMRHEDVVRRFESDPVVTENSVAVSPCSADCHVLQLDHEYDPNHLSNEDKSYIQEVVTSKKVGWEDHWACDISFLLDRKCQQISYYLRELRELEANKAQTPRPKEFRPVKGPGWYNNKRQTLEGNWMDSTTAHMHDHRFQTEPCAHAGPCINECPCFRANVLCESFCGCSSECLRRFTGCLCASSGSACISESCICIQMNRECGAECISCGAIARIDPENRHNDELFSTGCQNVVLQRNVSRCLIIGESQLEGCGFGLYAGEPIKKNSFVDEYRGEVISREESERRSVLSDGVGSYLFDINKEWTIDAARLGNKTRFINHAVNAATGENCGVRVLLVNGEHRIKFVALRDIAAGEELLFNYGIKYPFAEKNVLSKAKVVGAADHTATGKQQRTKGVVVGRTALDALDGLSGRTKSQIAALRTGAEGRRKARQTIDSSPLGKPNHFPEQLLDTEMDVDQEEEQESSGPSHQSPRMGRRYDTAFREPDLEDGDEEYEEGEEREERRRGEVRKRRQGRSTKR